MIITDGRKCTMMKGSKSLNPLIIGSMIITYCFFIKADTRIRVLIPLSSGQ